MEVVEANTQNCYSPNMTGSQLKDRRIKLGLSQQKLSQALELSLSTVARWEQLDNKEIPNSKLLELALLSVENDAAFMAAATKLSEGGKAFTEDQLIDELSKIPNFWAKVKLAELLEDPEIRTLIESKIGASQDFKE